MVAEKLNADGCHQIEGRYANYFQVGHNALEFVLDFGQLYVSGLNGHIHTRIITNPSYVKALLETLVTSIARYESQFGVIANSQTSDSFSRSDEEK